MESLMAGFQLSRTQNSSEFVGKTELYAILAADNAARLAPGDCVVITGDGDAVTGRSGITIAAQAAAITGVIDSIAPNIDTESLNDIGIAASTAGTCQVITDRASLFEVETSATLVVANVGLNAEAVVTAATQSGGLTISNMTLDQATVATTSTLHFRILRLLPGLTSGVLGDRALVRLNNTTEIAGATGIA